MDEEIFSLIAGKIDEAGTTDPREVADHYRFLWIDLKGSIKGYAALYNSRLPAIGLHVALKNKWYMFGGWHELAHIFCGDIYEPGFKNGHADNGFFNHDIHSISIAKEEKTANLIAADITIKDEEIELATNFNSPTLRSYRRMKAYQSALSNELEVLRSNYERPSVTMNVRMADLRRKIQGVQDTLQDMEFEMTSYNYNKTFSEMALELGITERILRYKLEAMRLKGVDIDPQELERYDRMFEDAV